MSRFSEQSELYARYRPEYPQELYNFIFKHLSARHHAWDCATGSGQVAKVLAEYFDEVIATDISEEQLRHAPQISNISYRIAPAEDSGLPSNYFDLITVAQAIHWFDFEQFYAEVRRVARSNALIAVIGYGMVRINTEVNPIIDKLYEECFGTYFNKNRQYLDEEYEPLPFPFREIATPEFKNTLVWTLKDLEGYFNSWSAVQKMKSELNINPVNKAIKQLRPKLKNEGKIEVAFPVFMRLGKLE